MKITINIEYELSEIDNKYNVLNHTPSLDQLIMNLDGKFVDFDIIRL